MEGYTFVVGGIEVQTRTPDQAVELLRRLTTPTHQTSNGAPKSLTEAVRDLFVESPAWRSPNDVLRALKARRETRPSELTYQKVYYVLRHGNYEKLDGKWKLTAQG